MKIGDKIRMKSPRTGEIDQKVGVVTDVNDTSVSVKYPHIGGVFTFLKANAVVIDENR